MFPEDLVRERLSLGGQSFDGTVVSVSFRVAQGVILEESVRVELGKIDRPKCISYVEASQAMEDFRLRRFNVQDDIEMGSQLVALQHVAEQLREVRATLGGYVGEKVPKAKFRVQNDDVLFLKEETVNNDARDMVMEVMIAANCAAGLFARRNGIALPFRTQKFPIGKLILKESGGVHAGLGVPDYVFFTSPIRRAADLISHRQIRTWLMKGRVWEPAEVSRGFPMLVGTVKRLKIVQNRISNYWQYEFVRRNMAKLTGLIRKADVGWWLQNELGQFYVEVPEGTEIFEDGKRVEIEVSSVEPRLQVVQANAVKVLG